MSIRSELQEALEELEVEVALGGKPSTFLWRYVQGVSGPEGGVYIPCMPGDTLLGATLGMGAPEPDETLLIKVRQNAFTSKTGDSTTGPTADSDLESNSGDDNLIPPSAGKFLIYEQKEWEIDRVKPDATGAYWLIYCVSPDS